MNYKEFMAYAQKNYNKGGDAIVECWEEKQFDEYVAECGRMTKERADALMGMYEEVRADEEGYADRYTYEDLGNNWY